MSEKWNNQLKAVQVARGLLKQHGLDLDKAADDLVARLKAMNPKSGLLEILGESGLRSEGRHYLTRTLKSMAVLAITLPSPARLKRSPAGHGVDQSQLSDANLRHSRVSA